MKDLIQFINQALGIKSERIKVKCHPTGNGFEIPFKNGTVDVPDQPDGYVIVSGCGSGKTESIKSLIRQKWDKGILYCVDTIAECKKMYAWLKDNLVGKTLNGQRLTLEDILMIHSESDFSDMEKYKNHPELVINTRILIITHVRFLTGLINLFVTYEPDNLNPSISHFDGDFTKLMTQKNLRTYLLFDETPLFLQPFTSIPIEVLGVFSNGNNGKFQCKSMPDMKEYYRKFIEGGDWDFCKGDTKVDKLKRETIITLISRYYSQWITGKEKKFDIHFYPADLIVPKMIPHVLIYEGVGDALFKNTNSFSLLDIPQKYNSTVSFQEFDFKFTRTNKPSDTDYNYFVFKIYSMFSSISGKTLIVIWKDFSNDDLKSTTNESEWVNRLKDELIEMGLNQNLFSVTYYGASNTKSTNEFRDYENIILCGNWDLPQATSAKFRKAYKSQTTQDEYKFWYYVQLITRIGIRNHNGGLYTVYHSSDLHSDFITALREYLNLNKLNILPRKTPIPLWQIEVKSKKYRADIGKIIVHYPDLENAIISHDSNFSLDITLDKISSVLGKTNRKQEMKTFKPLIRFLKNNFGITLNIQTKRRGKKKP